MDFGWNEAKRRENLRRRRVDFAAAARIFEGPVAIAEDTRRDYGETRFRAIGQVEGQAYVLAFTIRDETYHIITAWKVGKEGEARYRALLGRGSKANE